MPQARLNRASGDFQWSFGETAGPISRVNYVSVKLVYWTYVGLLCFRTLCVLGGDICSPRVTDLA